MVFIPIGMRYTATTKGAVLKAVSCEECGREYVYVLRRSASGMGSSPLFLDDHGARSRASGQAQALLRHRLQQGIDVVPCPACGRVQQHMVPKARRQYRRWMLNVGACLTLGLLPLGIVALSLNAVTMHAEEMRRNEAVSPPIPWAVLFILMAVVGLTGIGLMVGRFIVARRHEPNGQSIESRLRIGQARAMLRDDFEKMRREPGPGEG